jgi:hypothetical protein
VTLKQSDGLRALGGIKSGPDSILCPGPGHGKRDASLSVTFGPKYPEGFLAYSFSGDDWRECRDYVRDKLGLPAWKPGDKQLDAQPVFAARSWVYENEQGDEHHRVDAMSDGTFRHYHFDIDGWAPNAPDLIVPYALPDVLTDETIWIVRGEAHADLIRDGFGQVATTYPSGLPMPPPASFLYHLRDRDVRILDAGGALAGEFAATLSDALDQPVYRLPDGFRTLRQYAQEPDASLDACVVSSSPAPVSARITPTPFEWTDPASIPPREWVYDTHLIRKFVSLTVSPGGLGKSSLALVEALSLVTGRALLQDAVLHEGPLKVWYWNGEDPNDETKRRVMAACKHYGITSADLGGRLFTDSGRDTPLILGELTRDGITLNEALFERIEETMIANGIDVFQADPFVSAHRLGENDNNAIDAVIKRLGKMADRTNAAVEIVHHVRKPNSTQAETDVNDARGASALIGGVRSARVLNVMSEDIAQAAGVSLDLRQRYFYVTDGKANMSPKAAEARFRFLESVALGNETETRKSDNVGVVTYYKLPKEAKQVADLSRAEDEMRLILSTDDTVRHWAGARRGPKPKNWLGHRILEALQINDGDHDAAMQRLITGWIKEGKIVVRAAWVDKNRTLFLTLPDHAFEAGDTDESPSDMPF